MTRAVRDIRGTIRDTQPPEKISAQARTVGIAGGTVDKAIDILRGEGLVRTVTGRGIYVVPPSER
jgi:DNA-binding GntR family transcriptional regulator